MSRPRRSDETSAWQITASDLAVRTTAAGGFPASHLAGCPTKPNASAPSTGCDNDGDTYIDCNDFNCCTVVTCAKGTACNP